MKQKSILFGMCISMAFLLSTGCESKLGDFTLLSSKNVDLSNFSNSKAEQSSEQVVGEDCSHIIIFIPTGVPNMKMAVDRALESSNAYMLTNARLSEKFFYIPYIYGQDKFVVKGTPVKRK